MPKENVIEKAMGGIKSKREEKMERMVENHHKGFMKGRAIKGKVRSNWESDKKLTRGVHQLGLKDEPRHKTLSGKEVRY